MVTRPEDRHCRRGIRCHVTTERSPDVVELHGMRVCEPLRLFVHLAGRLDLVDAVVLGDAMVKVLGIKPAALVQYCEASDRHHARRAARAARYVREGVDSPMESRLRMLLVLAGLPEPTVNYREYDENGRLRRRYDLSYPTIKLIVEFDGRQHAESDEQWDHDIDRREELDDDGWRVLIVRAKDLYRHPARTIERVRRQLVARGWPETIRVGHDWREHFPGRG
jgi:very-short-patch-repair endonuclease